jgi:hypothetical protein
MLINNPTVGGGISLGLDLLFLGMAVKGEYQRYNSPASAPHTDGEVQPLLAHEGGAGAGAGDVVPEQFYTDQPYDGVFLSNHAKKHRYNPGVPSTNQATQFGANVDLRALRDNTLMNEPILYFDKDKSMLAYEHEYGFNISTPDTPTRIHKVYINANKPGSSSEFPFVPRD